MSAVKVASSEFSFADGNSGHACNLGSAPNADEWDVLAINSNTVVSTPSGWTLAETAVTNQGAYIFVRKAVGGESSSVTVTTSGNFNTQVSHERWSGLSTLDTSTSTQVNGSAGTSTPVHSTGTLAEATELVIAFGALHSTQSGNQSAPTWSSGYTAVAAASQGIGSEAVIGYTAYKIGAGTAAETPQVSWSGDGCFNRYMLTVSFTVTAGAVVEIDGTRSVTSTIVGAAEIIRSVAGSLAASVGIVGTATVSVPGAAPIVRSGWWGLIDIYNEARSEFELAQSSLTECPNDGEPLLPAPDGTLYCPFDGWPNE